MKKTTQEILENNEQLDLEWVDLELTERQSRLRIRVSADVVQHEGTRLAVTAQQHQLIADRFDAFLPTPKICDVIQARADIRVLSKVFLERGSHDEADVLSGQISKDLEKGMLELAATGSKNLGDGRTVVLSSNIGLNWVLSSQMEFDGRASDVSRHGLYADDAGSVSPVMPWLYRCWYPVGGDLQSDTASSVLHFARLVAGDVQIGTSGKAGRVSWATKRLDWALMHTSFAPMLHQGPMLRWTRVPSVPRALPRSENTGAGHP